MTCNESPGDNLPSLIVRKAGPSDIRSIFELANLSSVRDASFRSAPIKWEEHVSWFQAALADPLCGFYVADTGRLLAGQVRFSREGEQAVVSISVNPGFRGKGVGASLYHQGLAHFRLQHPVEAVEKVTAA
jgi:ribosomal protein S18 acetylase RimI-like enzyme